MNFGKKFLKSSKIFYLNSDDSLPDVKKKLKLDNLPCVWDIDSSSLAFQITMIDAQLFLKASSTRNKIKKKIVWEIFLIFNFMLFLFADSSN